MADLKSRILDVMGKGPFLASLATVTKEGLPWTRYVMGTASDELQIRFSTFLSARKVEQIMNNPEVHLTCGVQDPMDWESYLQVQGRAEVSTDPDEKRALWSGELERIFKGPDDPDYAVVIVTPYRIEINSIGKMEPEVWEG